MVNLVKQKIPPPKGWDSKRWAFIGYPTGDDSARGNTQPPHICTMKNKWGRTTEYLHLSANISSMVYLLQTTD